MVNLIFCYCIYIYVYRRLAHLWNSVNTLVIVIILKNLLVYLIHKKSRIIYYLVIEYVICRINNKIIIKFNTKNIKNVSLKKIMKKIKIYH